VAQVALDLNLPPQLVLHVGLLQLVLEQHLRAQGGREGRRYGGEGVWWGCSRACMQGGREPPGGAGGKPGPAKSAYGVLQLACGLAGTADCGDGRPCCCLANNAASPKPAASTSTHLHPP
jgi:hypothetical protein